MSYFRNIFDFYINSSIHVALSVVALSLMSYLEFGLPPDFNLLVFIFLGSITGYNFVKYAGLAKLHHRSLARNLRLIQIFSFFVILGLGYFVFFQTWKILLVSLLLGSLTLLYAAPVFAQNRNLRDFPGTKILIIAFVWAGVTVILPLMDQPEIGFLDKIIVFVQRLLFVVVITLPFEIRDLEFDSYHLATIPQKIGIKKTRRLGWALLGFILILESFKSEIHSVNFLSLFAVSLLSALGLSFAKKRQSVYFAAFWIEALPIFWVISWFILHVFV